MYEGRRQLKEDVPVVIQRSLLAVLRRFADVSHGAPANPASSVTGTTARSPNALHSCSETTAAQNGLLAPPFSGGTLTAAICRSPSTASRH